MSKRVDLAASRRTLAVLWGVSFAALTVFLVAQTAAGGPAALSADDPRVRKSGC